MRSFIHVAMDDDEEPTLPGGGPTESGQMPARSMRSHGIIALVFGFALGLTCMIFFGLFRLFGAPFGAVTRFVAQVNPNLWISFLCGFIGGTIVSAIYNGLLFRHLNLFGLDRYAD